MHLDNDWYGHRTILSEYCGVQNRPVFASILHGWIWNLRRGQGQRRFTTAPYLLWNSRNLSQGLRNGIANVRAIGAPFVYLCRITQVEDLMPEGTVFFPQHFTNYVHFETRHRELIAAVENRFPGPFTVSIFYSEPKLREIESIYKAAGWQIFCAGSRSDHGFLKKLHGCVAAHSYTVSNDFSSSIFYAAFLGRSVCILKDHLWLNSVLFRHPKDADLNQLAHMLFEGVSGNDARAIGSQELGEELALGTDDLKRLLGWSSSMRSVAAVLVSKAVNLKYGIAYRKGEKDL